MFPLESLAERRYLAARLFDSHIRFEKPKDVEVVRTRAPGHLLGCESQRNPELDRLGEVEARMGKLEIGRHHADDRVIPLIEDHTAVDDAPLCTQAPLPEL